MSILLTAPMMFTQSSGSAIPTDYIAYYTMDNISGSTLIDETGTYDGNLYSTSTMTGKYGQSVTTDGTTNSFIDISALPNDPDVISVSMWIYFTSLPASYARFFGHRDDATTLCLLDVISDGSLRLLQRTSTQSIRQPTGGAFTASSWNHVYALFSKTDGLYATVNNSIAINDPTAISGSIASTITMLGNNSVNSSLTGDSNSFNGGFDNVRFYNRALTTTEITSLYNE